MRPETYSNEGAKRTGTFRHDDLDDLKGIRGRLMPEASRNRVVILFVNDLFDLHKKGTISAKLLISLQDI